jgi:hypothetical protein
MVDDKKFGQEGQMIKRIAIAVLALFSLVGLTQAQQLAALQQPAPIISQKNVCAPVVQALLQDGGVAFNIDDVSAYKSMGMGGNQTLSLSYKFAYGWFGPDNFWDEGIMAKWQGWVQGGNAQLVIANRSVLPKVQSREWNQSISLMDPATEEKLEGTIWFAKVVAPVGDRCQEMSVAKGLFKENMDLPLEVWSILNPKVVLPPIAEDDD